MSTSEFTENLGWHILRHRLERELYAKKSLHWRCCWRLLSLSPALFAQANSGTPNVDDIAPDFTLKYFDGTDRKDVKLR